MSDIGPGDWVECIKALEGFAVSSIYCVDTVNDHYCTCGKPGGLSFTSGPALPRGCIGWCMFQFRPIYRPKASVIESLLQPEKEPA